MSVQHDQPPVTSATGIPAGQQGHIRPPVDKAPPTHSKVAAGLAAVACVACCALPFLIAAGVLTGAGAVVAQNVLLAVSGLLLAAAGMMWWLRRRRSVRRAAAGAGGCAGGTCDC